jgi:prepilin-type N-terminal cleavage/methylation domain-containing protein
MNRRHDPACAGFTLLELVVAMGILSGFLIMLVQFVDSGVRLFREGESGQNLADRGLSAQRLVEQELRQLRGIGTRIEPGPPGERLLVQWLPLGLPARAEPATPRTQVLRSAVHLDPAVELALQATAFAVRAEQELRTSDPKTIAARVEELQATEPLHGTGGLLLLPWPVGPVTDGNLELRVGRFLPGQLVRDRDRFVDPMTVAVPGSEEFPAAAVHAATEPLLSGILHCEFQFWSQNTRAWDGGAGPGPEIVWDSARAGWLMEPSLGPVFLLDRGGASLDDPTDDVFPRAIRVLLVVNRDPREPLEGLLAADLAADDRALLLVDGTRFPGATDGGHVKIGAEWLRYAEREGDVLRGLVRGQRGTQAERHGSGTAVRVGRQVEFVVPVLHGKDDWNG